MNISPAGYVCTFISEVGDIFSHPLGVAISPAGTRRSSSGRFMRQLYSFYSDAFWIALKSILEHKLRALLTLVGIIIGVAAVLVVSASIAGLKTYVIGQVSKVLGSNHFMITRMASMEDLSDEEFERRNSTLR